jgi:hypothetical protein
MTLRGIIVGAITQFSSDVICTSMLDTLITNHENATIVAVMKKNMTNALLFERQKLFQALFKSSTGGSQEKPMELMRGELTNIIEENVMLKHKNANALKSLKTALVKMKERESTIIQLQYENSQLSRQLKLVSRQPVREPVQKLSFVNAGIDETVYTPEHIYNNDTLIEHNNLKFSLPEENLTTKRDLPTNESTYVMATPRPEEESVELLAEEVSESLVTEEEADVERSTVDSDLAQGNSTTLSLDMAAFLES